MPSDNTAKDSDHASVTILFGSQTGYAQDTAGRIARFLWRHHFRVSLISAMDDYDKVSARVAP